MSILDIALLLLGGLWAYSRCCIVVQMRDYTELADEAELRYKDGSHASHGGVVEA